MKSVNILFSTLFTVAAVSLLAACSADNQPLQLPPPEPPAYKPAEPIVFEKTNLTQDAMVINIDKRVDVLFVIDDSASMKNHQDSLSTNIDRFVDHLSTASKDIDFHIAVTTVHDSVRYLKDDSFVPRTCKDEKGVPFTQWDDAGTLKPLKIDQQLINTPDRFVTNGPEYKKVLKSTLKVGAPDYIAKSFTDKNGVFRCARGPEFEDIFTPLMTVLSGNAPKVDQGFRRDGAFLVVILVTDAKDASGINADEVYSYLQSVTGDRVGGKRKLRVFAVAMNKGDVINPDKNVCKPDPAFSMTWEEYCDFKSKVGEKDAYCSEEGHARALREGKNFWDVKLRQRIPDHEVIKLARMTGDNVADGKSQVLSICSDYGATLAAFGEKIVRDVVHDVAVKMPYIPDMNKSRPTVSVGDVKLVEHQDWDYNEQSNEILIYSSRVDWSQFKGQQIKVDNFEPVNPDAKTTKPINEN